MILAIVIPYYKITFFDETLQSLANQTNKKFNVYIGNDASSDSPNNLITKYNEKINIYYKEFDYNLGSKSLVKHWGRCINLVEKEDWIILLGDDDILGENAVEEFYKNINEVNLNDINVIGFSTIKIDENSLAISEEFRFKNIINSTDYFFDKKRSSLSEFIFKVKVVNEIKFKDFPLAWCSDILAVLEFSNFNKIFFINTAIVKVRISKYSISGSKFLNFKKNKASFLFLQYLISKKMIFFDNKQKEIILEEISCLVLNNKKQFFWLLKLNYLLIINFSFLHLFKLNKNYIKSLFINE